MWRGHAKAIGGGIEASRIRETRIALHNFRLASRRAELQLLSSSALPVEFCRLTLASRVLGGTVGRILPLKENSVPWESLRAQRPERRHARALA